VKDYSAFERELPDPARRAWTELHDDETLFDKGLRALWIGIVAQSRDRSKSEKRSEPDR